MDYTLIINGFAKPKAKIDYLTIALPSGIDDVKSAAQFARCITGGRIECANRWRDHRDDWITIHDPSAPDLQYLLDHHHNVETQAIEIAIDFELKDRSNNMAKLIALHSFFKRNLYPQRHERLRERGKRKRYDPYDEHVKTDSLNSQGGIHSIYWRDWRGHEQVRLYIKTHDNRVRLDQYCVRMEITLYRGGCQWAGVHRVGLLPYFNDGMRRHLSRYFCVAKDIKPKSKRCRTTDPDRLKRAASEATKELAKVRRNWERYGAAWAAKHDYKVTPDADVNRLIGGALKGLRDKLKQLKLPSKVADADAWMREQASLYQ